MTSTNVVPSKMFEITYKVNASIIGIVIWIIIIFGLVDRDGGATSVLFLLSIFHATLITPLMIIFLLLNIWRSVKYSYERKKYLIISGILVPFIILGIYRLFNIDVP